MGVAEGVMVFEFCGGESCGGSFGEILDKTTTFLQQRHPLSLDILDWVGLSIWNWVCLVLT